MLADGGAARIVDLVLREGHQEPYGRALPEDENVHEMVDEAHHVAACIQQSGDVPIHEAVLLVQMEVWNECLRLYLRVANIENTLCLEFLLLINHCFLDKFCRFHAFSLDWHLSFYFGQLQAVRSENKGA